MYDYDRSNLKLAKGSFDSAKRSLAEKQLAEYGYTLTADDQIKKGEKTFSVVVSAKGPRFYVKQKTGAPVWSGADLGDFVAKFWFAKKV